MEGDEQQQIAQALNRASDWTNSISYIDGDAGKYQQFHHKAGGPPGAGEKEGPGKTQFPRQLPANYVCYRCGKPGHYILNCPTNGDPNFNGKMIKRGGPGIPQSFMQKITPEEAEKRPGAMLMQDGQYYVANPNLKALEPIKANATQLREDNRKVPDALKCPLCSKLLREAMQLRTCCGASFCEECIRPDDGETTVHCPICKRNNQLRGLVPNHELREKVALFRRDPLAYLRQTASPNRDAEPQHASGEQSDEEEDRPLVIPLMGGAMAKPQQSSNNSLSKKQAQQQQSPNQMKSEPSGDDYAANDSPQHQQQWRESSQEHYDRPMRGDYDYRDGAHGQHVPGRDFDDYHQSRGNWQGYNNRGYFDQGQYRQPYQQPRQYQQPPRQYQSNYQHSNQQPPIYQQNNIFRSRYSLDEYVVIDARKAEQNQPHEKDGEEAGNEPSSGDNRYRGPGSANWNGGDSNYYHNNYNYPQPFDRQPYSRGDRDWDRRGDYRNERRDDRRERREPRDSRDRSQRSSKEKDEYEKEREEQIERTKGLINRSSQAYFEKEGKDGDAIETEGANESTKEDNSEKKQSQDKDEDSQPGKEKSEKDLAREEKEREAERTRARILAERQRDFERAEAERRERLRERERERDEWARKKEMEREREYRERKRDSVRSRERGPARRDSPSRSSSRDRDDDRYRRGDERREKDSNNKERATRKRDRSDSESSREERPKRRHSSSERDRTDVDSRSERDSERKKDKHSHKKRRHETEAERDERKALERRKEKDRRSRDKRGRDSDSSASEREERRRSDKSENRRHKHKSHKSHRSSRSEKKHRDSHRDDDRDRRDRKDKRDSEKGEPEKEGLRRVVMIVERKEKIEGMKVEQKKENKASEPISVDSRSEG